MPAPSIFGDGALLAEFPSSIQDEDADGDSRFTGWLASSVELQCGLLVEYLSLDPADVDWQAAFA